MENHQCVNHTGHDAQIKALETSCYEMHANARLIVQGQHELRERIATVEASTKSAHLRLDATERLTEAIIGLAGEVKEVSKDTKVILERMEKQEQRTEVHAERIDKLEDGPGMIAIRGWIFAGGIIGTAIIAFFLGKVGL